MKRVELAILLILLLPAQYLCQSAQSIQGLVEDASGAVIAGAKVTMTNVATGISRSAVTNGAGLYNFPLVQVGNYDLQVEVSGFKAENVANIRVETAAQVRQNFKLQVGTVSENVEVSANAVQLNTENATTGGVIENKRIIDLPINGRNMVGLAVLIPGVQFGERTGRGDGLGGFPIPGSGFSVSANGQRETFQVVSLDGVDAKDPRIHITNFVPSIEAIEEFKIQTNAFTAEYGFGGGANVQITMKSGTNNLHGAFFDFVRNDIFDAENYFLNFERSASLPRLKKDPLRRNQFGFVLSGPVIIPKIYNGKNRTFWAFNMEHRLDRITSVQNANFGLDSFRRGDFSEILQPTPITGSSTLRNPIIIFDPYTGIPFPNNVIPTTRLHPGALNVLKQYVPTPQFRQADPFDFNATAGIPQPTNVHTYFARVDHTFSDTDRVFARLAWDRSNRTANNINPFLPVFVDSKVTNLAAQWIHSFSPTTINELRFGFNVSDDLTSNPRTDNTAFDMDSLGIGRFRVFSDGDRKLSPREHGLPRLNGLPFPVGENTNGNGYDNMDTIQVGNHVSIFRGKHNLKVGGELYYITMERGAANVEEGALAFSANESGYALASFLRFIIASILLFAIVGLTKTPLPRGQALRGTVVFGVLNFFASFAFVYWGAQKVPAAMTGVVFGGVPLMTYSLALLQRVEAFRWRGVIGGAIAVTGVATIARAPSNASVPLLYLAAVIIAAFGAAQSTIVIKRFPPVHPLAMNAIAMGVGGVFLLPLSVLTGERWTAPTQTKTWVTFVLLTTVGSVVLFILYVFVVQRWTASGASYQFVMFPVVSALVAWLIADGRLHGALILGALLVVVGTYVGALASTTTMGQPAPVGRGA
jgi:drug/metabolite transporter (DMT)-like permease